MILGVGTDILLIDRLRRDPADLAADSPFIRKTYTPAERQEADSRADRVLYLCTRFAGKEAVFKALNIDAGKVRLDQIEILGSPDGRPRVTLHGTVRTLAEARGVSDVQLSLSYDTDYAIAFAIAQNSQENQEEHK